MDLLKWINKNRAGSVTEENNRLEISHESGEHSTIWFRKTSQFPDALKKIDYFDIYDGADLFSSTFKIASIIDPKFRDGVQITFTLAEIALELSVTNASFPEEVIPFMIQQGIGIYSVGVNSGKIYEWDTELNEISEEFLGITSILDQWLQAVES